MLHMKNQRKPKNAIRGDNAILSLLIQMAGASVVYAIKDINIIGMN
jgi:hypothetical protein